MSKRGIRAGENHPLISHLSRIPNKDVRDLDAYMIQMDPQKRCSAEQYLDLERPGYFDTFFHECWCSLMAGEEAEDEAELAQFKRYHITMKSCLF